MLSNAYALIVGIANYQYVNPLPSSVLNDAQSIYDVLVDPHLCAYQPENVCLLRDAEATRQGLSNALAELAAKTDLNSTVLIYVSSHGASITSGAYADTYILPVETQYSSAQMLAETALSGGEFSDALQVIQASKLLVIFDCCHAAGIGTLKDVNAGIVKDGLPEQYYLKLATGNGRAIIASCDSNEKSYILPGATNSLFTSQLLTGLRGDIATDDGLIRIFDVFEYVQPRVTGIHSAQHPILKAQLRDNFPVALRLAGEPKALAKVDDKFLYDAYISFVDQEPDAKWVWTELIPALKAAHLKVAVSGVVEEPGVIRVVGIERGIRQSKRTVLVLSRLYLADGMAEFENALAQTEGIQAATYPLLPIKIEPIAEQSIPLRIAMLTMLDLTHPYRGSTEKERLIKNLKEPVPRRV